MKEIPLTQGFTALVDDEDWEWLIGFRWHTRRGYSHGKEIYAATQFRCGNRVRVIRMHTLILCPLPGFQVDHRYGNGLNNQKWNLRESTVRQNIIAKGLTAQNSSGFKGVSKDGNRWRAQIDNARNGVRSHLGSFLDPKSAAIAYDAAAVERYGEFAKTNKMLGLL